MVFLPAVRDSRAIVSCSIILSIAIYVAVRVLLACRVLRAYPVRLVIAAAASACANLSEQASRALLVAGVRYAVLLVQLRNVIAVLAGVVAVIRLLLDAACRARGISAVVYAAYLSVGASGIS